MPASISSYVRQCAARESEARRADVWLAWGVVVASAFLLVAMIFGAPLLAARGSRLGASALYGSFSFFCHQMPERSFHLAGHPLAVCARCLGIYTGFAAVALCYPLLRSIAGAHAPARAWIIAALVPMGLDFSLDFLGIWQNTHYSRLATGLVLGATTVFYVVPGVVELIERRVRARSRIIAEETLAVGYVSPVERNGV